MNLIQRESAEIYRREQQEIEEQQKSRLKLYGIWKTLRDVEPTGNELLDYLVADFREQALAIKEQVMEINQETE